MYVNQLPFGHIREKYMMQANNATTDIFPYVAESWEVGEGYRSITFKLRKGMKWSDGSPFTVDNYMWYWENECLNPDLLPAGPAGYWYVNDTLTKFVKVDDFTLRLEFGGPYRPVLNLASNWQTLVMFIARPDYVKKWHIAENPDANELAKSEGFDDWTQAYLFHSSNQRNCADVNIPSVGTVVETEIETDHSTYTRNPYCFEVDAEGNQLPYFDAVYSYKLDAKVAATKAVAGEFGVYRASPADIPVLQQNAASAGYRVLQWQSADGADAQVSFNLNDKDPVLRAIFQDLRFRQAMSIAINRQEINEICFFGLGQPIQSTVSPNASFYKPEWSTAFAEYDPERANALLDEMGLEWDAAKKNRLRPDGQPLKVIITWGYPAQGNEISELLREYWEACGVGVEIREGGDYGLYTTKGNANEIQVSMWSSDRIDELRLYLPGTQTKFNPLAEMFYAMEWERWHINPETGEEPPQEWKDFYEDYDAWFMAETEEEYKRLAERVFQFYSDQLVCIGLIGYGPVPIVARNELKNIPTVARIGDATNHFGTSLPQLWYLDEG